MSYVCMVCQQYFIGKRKCHKQRCRALNKNEYKRCCDTTTNVIRWMHSCSNHLGAEPTGWDVHQLRQFLWHVVEQRWLDQFKAYSTLDDEPEAQSYAAYAVLVCDLYRQGYTKRVWKSSVGRWVRLVIDRWKQFQSLEADSRQSAQGGS